MWSRVQYRLVVGAIVVAMSAGAGACAKRDASGTDDADAETKRAWQQPTAPAQAEQLRERLIMGQADH